MIKDIMKMGGCKTEAEFYKKYPTEKAFLEAFPQARPMMEQYQKGGTTGVAFPQAPDMDRFFNYGRKTMNMPRLMQAGGESQQTEQDAFLQMVQAVAQYHNVEPQEVVEGLKQNYEEQDLASLTAASTSNPDEVLQAINASTMSYMGQEENTGDYQYLEGQPFMQQMLDQQYQTDTGSFAEGPEESYQMPADPNQAMQMAYGGSKLRRFIPKHQTKGPVKNQQPRTEYVTAPTQEEKDPFWDTGLGQTLKYTAGIPASYYALKYGTRPAVNTVKAGGRKIAEGTKAFVETPFVRNITKKTQEEWDKLSVGQKLKDFGKNAVKKSTPKGKANKGLAAGVLLGSFIEGIADWNDWWWHSNDLGTAAEPTKKTAPLNTQDSLRAPVMEEDPDTSLSNISKPPQQKAPAQKGTPRQKGVNINNIPKDKIEFGFARGGEKKKFQPGGTWDKFKNYMSSATIGDMWRDLSYNLDRGGNPSEWVTEPRQWIGYTEDPETGEKLRYNEYGNEQERALAEEMKARRQDLLQRAEAQAGLAEQDPYMYSARPEWMGGSPNWRSNLSYATSGLAEKFSTDYDSPRGMFSGNWAGDDIVSTQNYRPSDFLNLGIGALTMYKNMPSYTASMMMPQMTQDLGDAAYQSQRTGDLYPYVSAVLNPLFLGRSGVKPDIAIGTSDFVYPFLNNDTYTNTAQDYPHFYEWGDGDTEEVYATEGPNAPRSVEQETPAAKPRVNINPFGTTPTRTGDPFSKNPKDRRPRLKKGGQSAPMGKSSNDDIVSTRLEKFKGYIDDNVNASIIKEQGEMIRNAFTQDPQEQDMEQVGDYMNIGGNSSGFISLDKRTPFGRRRAAYGQLDGMSDPSGKYSLPTDYSGDPSQAPESMFGYDQSGQRVAVNPEAVDSFEFGQAPQGCPPGYKPDPNNPGECIIAQTRVGKGLEKIGDTIRNASGQQLANASLAVMGTIGSSIEKKNMRKAEKQVEQNIWENQMASRGSTDKGYYLANSGDFVPPTMQTPVQFTGYNPGIYAKAGAEVDGEVKYLTDAQIKKIISLGGQVEFLD